MIKILEDNNVLDCILLMDKSRKDNDYGPYSDNERVWIEHLTHHIKDPHCLAIGDFDGDELRGFMLCSTFRNFYTHELVSDVKDCIVDQNRNNVFTVTRLFNAMIAASKEAGIKTWRADSLRASDKADEYVEFLSRKYNARPFRGVHGTIGD